MKSICVIGLGYIGLPTASLFANNGVRVHGVDINKSVVDTINAGDIHIDEVGLRTLVEAAVRSGQLTAATTASKADAFIIAVPTPFGAAKEPDLSHVFDAVDLICPHLEPDNLVIIESTIPPGATREVGERIARCRPDLVQNGAMRVAIAHCPERVLPGKILKELVENERVIGGLDEHASHQAGKLYKTIVSGGIYYTDATTAEMVKLAENTFRDVNIALANELAVICQKLGINVWDVVQLASKHPRVNILSPGPGVGGHCIAVDPWFIASKFPDEAEVIRASRERNDSMPEMVIDTLLGLVKGIPNPKIACLGGSYKANVGDPRNSPALDVYLGLQKRLEGHGTVMLTDSHLNGTRYPVVSLGEALQDASLIAILVDHDEYKNLNPQAVAPLMRHKIIYDSRNILKPAKWRGEGFEVRRLGDGSPSPVTDPLKGEGGTR